MRALVVGGSRFLGKSLIHELLRSNFEVTVLNLGQSSWQYPKNVEHLIADRNDTEKMLAVTNGKQWDIVYDLVCSDAKGAVSAIDIFSGKTMRYVYLSSSFVYSYGQNLHEEQFDARSYRIPDVIDRLTTTENKRVMEAILAQKAPFQSMAVRVPFIFGSGDPTGKLRKIVQKIVLRESVYLPNLQARMSVAHVDDVAKAILKISLHNRSGSVNCASGLPISLQQLVRMIEQEVHSEIKLSDQADDRNVMPFSIKSDWYLDVNSLKIFDVNMRNFGAWLPDLLQEEIKAVYSEVYKNKL